MNAPWFKSYGTNSEKTQKMTKTEKSLYKAGFPLQNRKINWKWNYKHFVP